MGGSSHRFGKARSVSSHLTFSVSAFEMSESRSYKLTYFDIRGLAEIARFLFAVAKVPYEDERYSLTFGTPGDFSTIIRPEFDAAKASGELAANFGKVPILTVDGVKVGQSMAINRFLAREFGMMGANAIEAALIDALCEQKKDINDKYQKIRAIQVADEKAAAMDKWFAETLPEELQAVERALAPGPGPWLVGSSISLADIIYFQFLAAPKGFFDRADDARAAFASCDRIKAAMEATAANPELAAWIANRPAGSVDF